MVYSSLIFVALIFVILFLTKCILQSTRRKNSIGIFHLNCSSGGGGERVLWHAIEALFDKYPTHTIYIYTHKSIQKDTLRVLQRVRDLFKIDLISNKQLVDNLVFVPLRLSPLVEPTLYPFLTLFFQNFMSILVALEAAWRLVPETYMETIGLTFTLPVFKLLQCSVITYVHYPTISNDMILNVSTSSHASFNNREMFVKSRLLRHTKLVYYKILASMYGWAGRRADVVMVNSSWTKQHIDSLWQTRSHVVYPPCDVEAFKSLSLNRFQNERKNLNIISLAQFRPEKNHQLQIEAFDLFLGNTKLRESTLTLYGGRRDRSDLQRIDSLREFVGCLDLEDNIDIIVDASFERILDGMKRSDVALHSMKDEHFGIVLVEFMAAGLIVVAHNSGGPKTDIIDDGINGFLADDVESFGEKLQFISNMSGPERALLRIAAVDKSAKFSVQNFREKFLDLVQAHVSDVKVK